MLSLERNAIARNTAPRRSAASSSLDGQRRRRRVSVAVVTAAAAAPRDPDDSNSNRGFRILERAGGLLPQSLLVKSTKTAWRAAWKTMVVELAPQEKGTGASSRPRAAFTGEVDSFLRVDAASYGSRWVPLVPAPA